MRCYLLALGRKIPATHTDILNIYKCIYIYVCLYIYIYLCMFLFVWIPTGFVVVSIDTSHALNSHALLSALFRQKDSCHPYWRILHLDIQIYTYIYIFLRFQKNFGISHMYQVCTKYSCNVICFFRQKDSCHQCWHILYICGSKKDS